MSGYVYILTNRAMPGLVKIGSTNMTPHYRAKQLQTTGVPAPFTIYGYVEVDNPKEIERATHIKLSRFRYSKSREYFRIDPEKAVEILESVSGQYELKRQQMAADAARRKKEQEERKRQRQFEEEERKRQRDCEMEKWKRQKEFEEELFSFLEMACEEAEEKVNVRLYKKLEEYSEEYSWNLLTCIFLVGLCLFKYVEIEVLISIGIVWTLVWLISLVLSKIARNKIMHFEKIVCSTMKELFGQTWQTHKEKCVAKLYEKYIRFR